MEEVSEMELFETVAVRRAVATLAIPTMISQIVSIIYNLADTCVYNSGMISEPVIK